MSKVIETARARVKAAGNKIRVGSDLHLVEMLLSEIDRLREQEWQGDHRSPDHPEAGGKSYYRG